MKYKKFIVLGIIAAVLVMMCVFDYARAQSTKLEVVSITPETIVADPNVSCYYYHSGNQAGESGSWR